MSRLFPRKPLLFRRLRVRAPFYSSIPRFVAGTFYAFRVPIAVLTIGAGAYAYADYKLKQIISTVKDTVTGSITSTYGGLKSVFARVPSINPSNIKTPQFVKDGFPSDAATGLIASASGGLKSASARVSTVKPSDIKTPQFVKDIFSSDAATGLFASASGGLKSVSACMSSVKPSDIKTPQFVKDVFSSDAATGLIASASSGLKSVSARVPWTTVKPPKIETPQSPKDPFHSDDSTHHDHSSSSQDSGNPPNTSPEENAVIAAPVAVTSPDPSDSTKAEEGRC